MKLLLLLLTIISLKAVTAETTRNGRCPSPQYVASGLVCSTEGDDSVCPSDYKCCPLTNGMKCFSPCPEFTQPCTIQCLFGLKVDPSPCTVCECAPDPCLLAACPLGTKCITKDYEPCAINGRCGLTTECIDDPSIHVDPTPKPNKCPDYWPSMGSGLQTCRGPDALCPGEEKCCQAPMNNFNSPNTAVSYCVQPCEDISNCTLQCSHGLVIDGGCQICQCAPDPCDQITCPAGQTCRLLPAPCAHFPGRPPCPLLPVYETNTQQTPFDTIVSFGDSSTDTGNVYNLTYHTWPIVPPYFQGRFSNGPVWIEKLGVLNIKNDAYGGATTDNGLIQGYTASDTIPVPGVRQQIVMYLNRTNTNNMNFARTLYIICAGGNDYYFNNTIRPSTVATSILNGAQDLLKIGVKHLLIVNQSPVHAMPFIRTQEQVVYYKERTTYHNNNLSIGIAKLDYNRQEISLYLFDIYSLILKIMANDSLNTKDNCWNVLNGNVTILCSNPESYIYIDQYHFTAKMHGLIGDAVRQFIFTSSGITKLSYSIAVTICTLFFLILSSSS